MKESSMSYMFTIRVSLFILLRPFGRPPGSRDPRWPHALTRPSPAGPSTNLGYLSSRGCLWPVKRLPEKFFSILSHGYENQTLREGKMTDNFSAVWHFSCLYARERPLLHIRPHRESLYAPFFVIPRSRFVRLSHAIRFLFDAIVEHCWMMPVRHPVAGMRSACAGIVAWNLNLKLYLKKS